MQLMDSHEKRKTRQSDGRRLTDSQPCKRRHAVPQRRCWTVSQAATVPCIRVSASTDSQAEAMTALSESVSTPVGQSAGDCVPISPCVRVHEDSPAERRQPHHSGMTVPTGRGRAAP